MCVCVCVCVCIMEYYSVIKKNKILPLVTAWIDLEGVMLSKISHTQKNKYCMISHIWNNEKQTKQTHRYREQFGGCWKWGVRKVGKKAEGSQNIQTSSYKINIINHVDVM